MTGPDTHLFPSVGEVEMVQSALGKKEDRPVSSAAELWSDSVKQVPYITSVSVCVCAHHISISGVNIDFLLLTTVAMAT